MNSQSSAQTLTTSVMLTPHGAIVLTFMAIVLGTTLVEFNDVLFPPKFGSLNFWALAVVYYGAFTTWFGIVTATSARPYRDTFFARTWLMCGIMMLVAYVAVMFFAYNTVNSLFYYLWGWVGVFFFYGTSSLFRYLDLRRPEPFRLCAFWSSSVIAIAVIYSIWSILFPPIPMIANWIFLLVSFVNISGYRVMLRTTHAWQPTPTDQQ